MRRFLLIFFAFIYIPTVWAQLIRQNVTNFTPREYGNFSAYTYSIAEDKRGIIYVGTSYGILQYDGINWRFIPVKAGTNVTALLEFNQKIYVGCQGDFGYLETDSIGKLHYKSLTAMLPENDRKFSTIWKVLATNGHVVFQSEEKIFDYYKDQLKVLTPETSFHLAFETDKMLFVRERDKGLKVFTGEKFVPVQGSEIFAGFGVFAILEINKTSKLIVTCEKGLWKLENNQFTQIQLDKDVENVLTDAVIKGGIKLRDGNFALYSMKNGIFILDKSYKIIANYSMSSGLRSSEIHDLIQDHYGNLWSATQKGINRIQYSSPISVFNESSGIFGNVQSIAMHENTYLIGTSEGLYMNDQTGVSSFHEVKEVKGSVWSISKTPENVWIGTENGIWIFDDKKITQLNNLQSLTLLFIPEKSWIVSAGKEGVSIFDAISKKKLFTISDIQIDAYGSAYQLYPSGDCDIWFGSKTMGVWVIHVTKDNKMATDSYYGQNDGLPEEWVAAYQAGNTVLFGTSKKMLKFISADQLYKLSKDSSIDKSMLRGYFDYANFPKDTVDKAVTSFLFDASKSYIALDYFMNSIGMNDSIPSNFDFKALQLGRLNVIGKIDNNLLIGGNDGLAIVNQSGKLPTFNPDPNLLIRLIITGKDTIWEGDQAIKNSTIEVPYSKNSIVIELASTYSDNGMGPLFSWRFGEEIEFTNWSNDHRISLSNLREGDYEIHIAVRNIHDKQSREFVFKINVMPPWYRTWWAYSCYGVILILLVIALIQVNIHRLKEKNRKLEEIVRIRTKEVVEQKEQIQIQKEKIEEILHEIRSSITYARRIQRALLPSEEFLQKSFADFFILFMPRDVVSGDFYWASKTKGKMVITAADCTGHGVPGAFMSMLGMSLLNEIVEGKGVTDAGQIIDILRQSIIYALGQKGELGEQKDGMDMSLVVIDFEQKSLQYAGANNPLWIIRKDSETPELIEIKADKMPVAIHEKMDPFKTSTANFAKGDMIFMFSDGFADQFGGPQNKKLMSKQFKQILTSNSSLKMNDLKQTLEQEFLQWKGENPQVDDVVVIGIRF